MSDKKKTLQAFSEKQHSSGKWNSKKSYLPIPFLKSLINFLSFKRLFVYKLSISSKSKLVLDMGCGKGAYSQWYKRSNKSSTIVAMDWSVHALKDINATDKILLIAADVECMPFKSEIFDSAFSVDTLGHIEHPEKCLDELYRVCKDKAHIFIHSESSDYQKRWPDRKLIKKLGKDFIAEKDGHYFIKSNSELYKLFRSRFFISQFISPAGITAWITGYPENYLPLFKQAGMFFPYFLVIIPSFLRRLPIIRQIVQFTNAIINRIELFFGISGGGSVFAIMRKEK